MLAVRESEQFGFEFGEKRGAILKMHKSRFKLGLVDVHPADFISFDRDQLYDAEAHGSEFLRQSDAG